LFRDRAKPTSRASRFKVGDRVESDDGITGTVIMAERDIVRFKRDDGIHCAFHAQPDGSLADICAGQDEPPASERERDPIRTVVEIDVHFGRKDGLDKDQIRRKVLDHAREAIEGGDQRTFTEVIDGKEELLITPVMCYRLAFARAEADFRGDLYQQEALLSRIEKTVAELLAD
jgi:hypothetical protein